MALEVGAVQCKVTVDSETVKNFHIQIYIWFTRWWVDWTMRGERERIWERLTTQDVYEATIALEVGAVQWKVTVDSEIVKNFYIQLLGSTAK